MAWPAGAIQEPNVQYSLDPYMRGSLSRHFGVPFISKDAERACSGLERMIEQGIACCTLYSFRLGR
jgi:hypothetical protein